MENMVPRSRSGEGDTRATGDNNSLQRQMDELEAAIASTTASISALSERTKQRARESRERLRVELRKLGPAGAAELADLDREEREEGIILQPHTDGVLAPPLLVEPEFTDSTPRVTLVGGGKQGISHVGEGCTTPYGWGFDSSCYCGNRVHRLHSSCDSCRGEF